MSELLKDFVIHEDVEKRIDWIDKRIGLSELHRQYIGFQMKEALATVLNLANGEIEQHQKALHLRGVVPSTFEKNRTKEAIRKWFLDKTGDEINPLYLDEIAAKITKTD